MVNSIGNGLTKDIALGNNHALLTFGIRIQVFIKVCMGVSINIIVNKELHYIYIKNDQNQYFLQTYSFDIKKYWRKFKVEKAKFKI